MEGLILSSWLDAKAQMTGPTTQIIQDLQIDMAVSASVVSAAILVPGCNP